MRHLLTVALLALGATFTARAQDENPFSKATPGEWAEYDFETTAMNISLKGKFRLTVMSMTDKEAKLKATIILDGQKDPAFAQDTVVPLDKPFDPASATGLPGAAGGKVDVTDKGKTERLTLAGKQYECSVSTMKLTAKVTGQDFESEVKVWLSKEIPLAGLAKMDVRSALAEMKMTYAGSGKKE